LLWVEMEAASDLAPNHSLFRNLLLFLSSELAHTASTWQHQKIALLAAVECWIGGSGGRCKLRSTRSSSRVHTRILCQICRNKLEFRQTQTHSWRKNVYFRMIGPNWRYAHFPDSRDGLFDCSLLFLQIFFSSGHKFHRQHGMESSPFIHTSSFYFSWAYLLKMIFFYVFSLLVTLSHVCGCGQHFPLGFSSLNQYYYLSGNLVSVSAARLYISLAYRC
jgi:hypothetical protein